MRYAVGLLLLILMGCEAPDLNTQDYNSKYNDCTIELTTKTKFPPNLIHRMCRTYASYNS